VVVSRDDGNLDPDELLAAIGENRSWADLARLTGESSALHAAPPLAPHLLLHPFQNRMGGWRWPSGLYRRICAKP